MRKAIRPAIGTREKSGVESIHAIDELHFKTAVKTEHFYRPDHFTIMFVQQGELVINYNLGDIHLRAPGLIFTIPDSQFILKSRSEDIKLLSLFYSPDFVAETGIHMTGSAARKFFGSGMPPYALLTECEVLIVQNLMQILNRIINQPCPHDYNNAVIKNCFMALLFEVGAILTKNIPVTQVRLSRKETLTIEFMELLSIHFNVERSVSFYADKLHITVRHLSHTTKAIFGKSAGEMIDEMVITEAKNLLKNPQYNISQIADALNFSNPSFFGKFFKKRTGKSPSEYRVTIV
ncbi:MAG: helix-turn-helix domain-containing protein [Bacteroidota bacterium]